MTTFKAGDGYFLIAAIRRHQLVRLAELLDEPEWLEDPRLDNTTNWSDYIEDIFRPGDRPLGRCPHPGRGRRRARPCGHPRGPVFHHGRSDRRRTRHEPQHADRDAHRRRSPRPDGRQSGEDVSPGRGSAPGPPDARPALRQRSSPGCSASTTTRSRNCAPPGHSEAEGSLSPSGAGGRSCSRGRTPRADRYRRLMRLRELELTVAQQIPAIGDGERPPGLLLDQQHGKVLLVGCLAQRTQEPVDHQRARGQARARPPEARSVATRAPERASASAAPRPRAARPVAAAVRPAPGSARARHRPRRGRGAGCRGSRGR